MQKLFHFYVNIMRLEEKEAEYHISKFEKIGIPKKTNLTNAGEVENYLYFIDQGIVRFFINKSVKNEVKEITFSFTAENSFTSAYDSFITRKPSVYSIQTLKKTTVYRIHYKDIHNLYNTTQVGNYLGRISAEQLYVKKAQREIAFLLYSAEERYLNLMETFPEYILQIPLKYIASYLGVTPQALSRIRKRIF